MKIRVSVGAKSSDEFDREFREKLAKEKIRLERVISDDLYMTYLVEMEDFEQDPTGLFLIQEFFRDKDRILAILFTRFPGEDF
jgi:hypothetical protein